MADVVELTAAEAARIVRPETQARRLQRELSKASPYLDHGAGDFVHHELRLVSAVFGQALLDATKLAAKSGAIEARAVDAVSFLVSERSEPYASLLGIEHEWQVDRVRTWLRTFYGRDVVGPRRATA